MSPGDARLAGNEPDQGEGPTYYVGCEVCEWWVEPSRNLVRRCSKGHRAVQVKVRLACPRCGWKDSGSNWHETKPPCPRAPNSDHHLKVLEYSKL